MELKIDFQPAYHCSICKGVWGRPGSESCQRCGTPAEEVSFDLESGDVQALVRQEDSPMRQVLVHYPNWPWVALLECGHYFISDDKSVVWTRDDKVGCGDCWRDTSVKSRKSRPKRNLMMVRVQVPAH